ncbi:MAG: hypothetical protein V3U92_01360 [Cellulophaga sp.]
MNSKIYEYSTKISYTHFITPAIGAFCIYAAITNEGGLGYRGKLIMTYPGSSYFLATIGILFLLPLIYTYFKAKKKNSVELGERELIYTKGTIINKEVVVNYTDFKEISFEDSEDDGSSICIDSGKFFDHQFYAKKFKSISDYTDFCEQISSIVGHKN